MTKRRVVNYDKCRLENTEENYEYWSLEYRKYGIAIYNEYAYKKILFINYKYNIKLLNYINSYFYAKFNIIRKKFKTRKFLLTTVFTTLTHILCYYHNYHDRNNKDFEFNSFIIIMKKLYTTYKNHKKIVKTFICDFENEIKKRCHKKAKKNLELLTNKYGLQNDLYDAICNFIA